MPMNSIIISFFALLLFFITTVCSSNIDSELNSDEEVVDTIWVREMEFAHLKAEAKGEYYLWSTGDTTASIMEGKSGDYWVKIYRENKSYTQQRFYVESTWRLAKISTRFGDVLIWLFPQTPKHKEAFLKLVNENYFDGQSFNRVINNFVIQGGCPDEAGGFSDTSLFIDAEIIPELNHIPGAFGGGRDENKAWRTNICQFYIVDSSAPNLNRLDDRYTIFGQVISGLSVVDSISNVPTDNFDHPLSEIGICIQELIYTQSELKTLYHFDVNQKM